MPRPTQSRQLNLFPGAKVTTHKQMPTWQTLPRNTRQQLSDLMAHLFLNHVDDERGSDRGEKRDDV